MKNYFKEHITKLNAYEPGLQPDEEGFIKLNTNENPYPPSPKVIKAIQSANNEELRLYPNPNSDKLKCRIAEKHSMDPGSVLITNGSDEALALIAKGVLGKGDLALITDPTYILYEVLIDIQAAIKKVIALDEQFELPKKIDSTNVKLAFFSNPNTPVGNMLDQKIIARYCQESEGIVVIDEAYIDFAQTDSLELIQQFNNVLITRSFSKSFALAGMRIGYILGEASLIANLNKIKDSYNVNRLSAIAAEAALNDETYRDQQINLIIRDRAFLVQQLSRLQFDVLPSAANFIFVKHNTIESSVLYKILREKKILVRYFDKPRLRDYLRITVGTHQDILKLVKAIEDLGRI